MRPQAVILAGPNGAGKSTAKTHLWVPDPDFAVARVALRVRSGGHDIPEATIRRRYFRGLRNFFEVYAPVVNRWRLYDNSQLSGPILIEKGVRSVRDRVKWERIRQAVAAQGDEK